MNVAGAGLRMLPAGQPGLNQRVTDGLRGDGVAARVPVRVEVKVERAAASCRGRLERWQQVDERHAEPPRDQPHLIGRRGDGQASAFEARAGDFLGPLVWHERPPLGRRRDHHGRVETR